VDQQECRQAITIFRISDDQNCPISNWKLAHTIPISEQHQLALSRKHINLQ